MEILTPNLIVARKTTPPRRTDPLGRLEQFYHAAKKAEWSSKDLPWDKYDPVPRVEQERWRLVWASVVKQQLQADIIAVNLATKLLVQVEEREAQMYYGTMVQDEGRHCEVWSKLAGMMEDVECDNPYLREMGDLYADENGLEHLVVAFQACFEGAAIYAFKDISKAAHDSVLGAVATKLIKDDSIHHNSGVAYARYLLDRASPALKKDIHQRLKTHDSLYTANVMWRPKAREWRTGGKFYLH